MPQKIDVHGIFLDPETITDLQLQKRISVSYPVFKEVEMGKSFFGRFSKGVNHKLSFVGHQLYGIILADAEKPDPSSYVVNYQEAAIERFLKGFGQVGKNLAGHISELLKIDYSGDRQVRILQSGRNVKQLAIREIPAKVQLLSGQWVDVFKSTPEYDFQGGTPYAITDVGSSALMITTNTNAIYILYGGGVDAADAEVVTAYRSLAELYNQIQAKKDARLEEKKNRPLIQLPQINIQLPKVELPKIEMPQIRFQSPFVIGKKAEEKLPIPDNQDGSDQESVDSSES